MNDRFVLEDRIMKCWNVTDDIDMVTEYFVDNPKWEHMPADITDAIMNKYFGIKELYEIRFQQLWDCFEDMVHNHQFVEQQREEFDDFEQLDLMLDDDPLVDTSTITLGELSDYTMKDDVTPTVSFSYKNGDQRSQVAHSLWERVVTGSNPVSPTMPEWWNWYTQGT